jgi:hypothetical protein
MQNKTMLGNIKNIPKRIKVNLIPVSLITAVVFPFINVDTNSGSNGNVEQWINNTNETIFGKNKFYFSYGPLYWLLGGTTTQQNMATYIIAFLTILIICTTFWYLIINVLKSKQEIVFASATFLLVLSNPIRTPAIYLIFPFILVFILEKKRILISQVKFFHIVSLSVLISIFFYSRFLYGFSATMVFGSYVSFKFLSQRKYGKLIQIMGFFVLTSLGIGYLIYGSMANLFRYIQVNLELSRSNSIDMSYDVSHSVGVQTLAVFISLLVVYLSAKINRNLIAPAIILNFIFFKIGFGRADHYLDYFIYPIALMIMILNTNSQKKYKFINYFILFSLVFIGTVGTYAGSPTKSVITPLKSSNTDFKSRMKNVYSDFKLPNATLRKIGQGSIDFYPYNNEFAFANDLNYQHRPLTQSYMTLTPLLGKLNAEYLASESSPKFIIWNSTIVCNFTKCNPFQDFDQKYVLNSDPVTSSAILYNYKIIDSFNLTNGITGVLLKKKSRVDKFGYTISNWTPTKLGTWINIPVGRQRTLFIEPEFRFTTFGKLTNSLFRGGIIYVSYQFDDDLIETYRVNISSSAFGLYANYLPSDFNFKSKKVVRLKFTAKSSNYVKSEIKTRWKYTNLVVEARDQR